jgi:hypothetical protein
MLVVFVRKGRGRSVLLVAAQQKCVLDYKWISNSEIASLIVVLELELLHVPRGCPLTVHSRRRWPGKAAPAVNCSVGEWVGAGSQRRSFVRCFIRNRLFQQTLGVVLELGDRRPGPHVCE